jgi:hypothetical protein
VKDRGAIEQSSAPTQGEADQDKRQQGDHLRANRFERVRRPVNNHVLQEKIVDGVPAEAELGKQHNRGPHCVCAMDGLDRLGRVGQRVGWADGICGDGHPHKSLRIKRMEVVGSNSGGH